MAKIEVEIGGFVGKGSTLKAARENAEKLAGEALRGDYHPRVYRFGAMVLLVSRSPKFGWEGSWLAKEDGEIRVGGVGRDCGWRPGMTPEQIAEGAAVDAAQRQWKPEGSDEPPAYLSASNASDFRSWTKFQRKMIEGINAGLDHNFAHQFAGGRFVSLEAALAAQAKNG